MNLRFHGLAAFTALLFASSTFAQTNFPEIEPNSQKSEATAVNGIVSGDTISGTTTGIVTTLGSTLGTTVDMFRVKTGALTPGIYRHRLTLTTTGTTGHLGNLRGLSQTGTVGTGGTIGTIDTQVQLSSTATTPARFVQWYGFGNQESVYYRVEGTASTTAPYTATLATNPVTPTVISQAFEAGTVTITTVGQTTADTELFVYDSSFNAIPGFLNDDEPSPGTSTQSRLTRTFAPGTYYIAVSSINCRTSAAAPADDRYVFDSVMDFPDSICRDSSSTVTADWDFKVTGTNGTLNVANQLPANAPFDITFFTLTVMVGAPPIITPPPANDLCANATDVTGLTTFTGDISGALNDGAASCDPSGSARDVWFTYTNTSLCFAKTLAFDTCTTAFDTVLSVYSGCGGAELACSDDCAGPSCTGTTSCVSGINVINVNPLQSVRIRLSDKGIPGGSLYTLHITATQVVPPPTNDDCAAAIALPGAGTYCYTDTGATTGSQGQAESACLFFGFMAVRQDIWYTYVASANGTANITTCGLVIGGPSQDTKVAIYVGAGCPTSAAIACNDDSNFGTGAGPLCSTGSTLASNLNFPVTCGTTYTIQLGMYGGTALTAAGQFALSETGSSCNTPFSPYCSGDGSDTACPCANPGLAGRGCDNTVASGGALLTSTGVASVASPTLVLNSTFAVPFGPGLYYEGNATALPGPQFGATFGNGLRCAGGATNRLEIRFADATGAANTTVDLQAFGAAVASTTYYYQQWYRDTGSVGTCTPGAGFNLSNAISLTWAP